MNMEGKIYTALLAVLLSVLSQVSGSNTYRAAVVEYHPVTGADQQAVMMANVANYKRIVEQASKKKADIVVFPEGGLGGEVISSIPDPVDNVVPCDDNFQTSQAVKELSCAAKRNSIYLVVNLGEMRKIEGDKPFPDRDFYIFNTNVVFDSRGAVIARYAKYNLFATDLADQPKEPELVFFDTSFGVRFGTFICFDILFPSPAQRLVEQYNIQNFVFTTYWFSELPFLTALQAQRGWAEANNVNLLASGMNFPSVGSTGSGIYNGKFGHLVEFFSQTNTTKLLIADVPVNPRNTCTYDCRREIITLGPLETSATSETAADQGLTLLKDVLDHYGSEVIKDGEEFEKTVCSPKTFCCDFKIKMSALKPEWKNYTYRAVAFSGVRNFGAKFRGGAQVCAVVVCNGPDIKNCTNRAKEIPGLVKFNEIQIKGNFKLRNSFQMPSTLTDGKDLLPLPANKYSFVREETEGGAAVSLELLWPVTDLHTFAIWGRDFVRDMEPAESSATSVVSMPLILASIIGFVLLVR